MPTAIDPQRRIKLAAKTCRRDDIDAEKHRWVDRASQPQRRYD
jgi:hypothetical protein